MPKAVGKVRASTSFAFEAKDGPVVVHQGDVLPASSPAVKAAPGLFEPVKDVGVPIRAH